MITNFLGVSKIYGNFIIYVHAHAAAARIVKYNTKQLTDD